ncbi:resuscitation-promoting factor [Corynebacterium yudongzhengii]|uniref:DUF348 domain-containing protein n=1 Tax=Corynebacterium yudongzhengii TaxID=2080740 RepID=A0A2U1T7X9_9CORY|nr:resuscitation-promoting factor [Corynebacterium yudongzhengii]AWB82288.1 resuscitation-promoting factor [Corynebacterium yudongzhengii]PWC02093.1 DUF348 domain-containing protein [Corynebacterium yudongzhengii]
MAQHNTRIVSPKSTPARLIAGGALGALAIGGVAAAGSDKDVTVDYNGETLALSTYAKDVAGALEKAGVEVSADDLVSPAPVEPLADGDTITVHTVKPVAVSIDGAEQTLRSAAATVGDLVKELGNVPASSAVSADYDAPLTEGMQVDVTTPKIVAINDGGTVTYTEIAAGTVGDVLKTRGVTVDSFDRVSPSLDTPLTTNTEISIERVDVSEDSEREAIEAPVNYVDDPEADAGTERVVEEGTPGERQVLTRTTYVNGELEGTEVVSEKTITEATPTTIARGTRVVEEDTSEQATPAAEQDHGGNTGAPAPAVANGGVWDRLAQCESGGNWSIDTGNGFSGGLQFHPQTWAAYGGTAYAPTAAQASREQQIAVAEKVQAGQGWGAWPACTASMGIR